MGELILNLTNCESSITDHFLFEDDLKIENFVYANGEITSCTFKIWSVAQRLGNTYDLISMGMLSEDKKSITFDFQKFNNAYQKGRRNASWWNSYNYNQYTITATAEEGIPEPDLPDEGEPPYTPSETEINYFMERASSDRTERIDVWEGSFTITADEGFIIDTAFFKFFIYRASSVDYDLMKMGYITEDRKSLIIDLEDFSDRLNSDGRGQRWRDLQDYQEIHVTTIEEGFVDKFFNANDYLKTYIVDDKILLDLSMLIFRGEGSEGLASNINNIYSIPFDVDEGLINTVERDIYLGNTHTDIKGRLLKTSSLIYDLGNIHVPAVYSNVYDYKDTECIVHIPFSEPIKIDEYKVIDCIVNCTLYIDIYTGSGTVIITSSNINGEVINKVSVKVGYEIPIYNQQGIIGNLKDYEFNLDYTFKIEVNRNIPVDVGRNDIIEYGKVSDYENLIVVDDLKIDSISTVREKEEIKNLLSQGIFIK